MGDETHSLGPWQPWSPLDVAGFFAPLTVPWWIAGGWAIDLFLGRQTREHEDIDVQVLRRDQRVVRALFGGWDMQAASPLPRDDVWLFRRTPTIERPVATIGCVTADEIPYLAPEIQPLYKAKGLRPKDEADFARVLPALNQERR